MKQQLQRRIEACAWAVVGLTLLVSSTAMAWIRPDILLISLDTVRADYLTFRDSETAPNMTALARDGAVFTQAVSGSSWTLPAHAQIFTGTPPVIHRVLSDSVRIDPRMSTLPEVLQRAGYYTAGFYTADYLGANYGFARGFDIYGRPRPAKIESGGLELESAPSERKKGAPGEEITSPAVIELVRKTLERADPDKPLFLFAHFFDPHDDYIPPPPWDRKFDPDYTGDMTGRHYYWNKEIYDPDKEPARQIGDRDLEHIRSLYRGEIGWTDRAIGELLDLLAERGRLDSTLIIITADHGEEFFEHGDRGHRVTLFDEVLRVPLLIVPPKALREGLSAVVEQQASLSDLLSTIADFAGVAPPATATGQSLRPAMYGAEAPSRPELSSLHAWGRVDGRFHVWSAHGLRTPEHKLIRIVGIEPGSVPVLERVLYFDLLEDPGEYHPIMDATAPKVQDAWKALESELDQARKIWNEQSRSSKQDHTIEVSTALSDRLVALGYMEADEEAIPDPVNMIPSLLAPLEPMEPPISAERRWNDGYTIIGSVLVGALIAMWLRRSRSPNRG